jgi:hypothetical protein
MAQPDTTVSRMQPNLADVFTRSFAGITPRMERLKTIVARLMVSHFR